MKIKIIIHNNNLFKTINEDLKYFNPNYLIENKFEPLTMIVSCLT